jgi:hypothetical protein
LADLDYQEQKINSANHRVSLETKWDCIMDGMHSDFYERVYSDFKEKYGDIGKNAAHILELRAALLSRYNCAHPDIRAKYATRSMPKPETVLKTTVKKKFDKPHEKRHCDYCEMEIPVIKMTHNTDVCNKKPEGWVKPAQNRNIAQVPAYYDTCASSHISFQMPKEINRAKTGAIESATGDKVPIIGQGNFKLGKIDIENVNIAPKAILKKMELLKGKVNLMITIFLLLQKTETDWF